jgi:hypothetical protein
MKIYPSITDQKLVIATAWLKCVQWTPVIALAGSLLTGLLYWFNYGEVKLLAH